MGLKAAPVYRILLIVSCERVVLHPSHSLKHPRNRHPRWFPVRIHCKGPRSVIHKCQRERLQIEPRDPFGGEAVEQFREYIWANPNDPAGHHSLGMAYCQLGEFAQAIDPFLRALRLGPEFAEVYQTLGTAYSELEQHDNVASAFQNAVRLEPDNAANHCSLATSYLTVR
jgi:cytochrome c-type biogenesis protein CcmH/NrfG